MAKNNVPQPQHSGASIEKLMQELEEARLAALNANTPQSSAAVAATLGKARLLELEQKLVALESPPVVKVEVDERIIEQSIAKLRESY